MSVTDVDVEKSAVTYDEKLSIEDVDDRDLPRKSSSEHTAAVNTSEDVQVIGDHHHPRRPEFEKRGSIPDDVAAAETAAGVEDNDPNVHIRDGRDTRFLVGWDGPDDPQNPQVGPYLVSRSFSRLGGGGRGFESQGRGRCFLGGVDSSPPSLFHTSGATSTMTRLSPTRNEESHSYFVRSWFSCNRTGPA